MRVLLLILTLLTPCAWGALKFDADLVEVNVPLGAEKVTVDFTFRNTGKEAIKISHVDPDCDCIAIQVKGGKLNYLPGEAGQIRSEFNVGNQKGQVDEQIAIWLVGDPKDKPSIRLTARMKIPELITLSHKTIKWEVGAKAEAKRIEVTMKHDQPIRVTAVKSSSKDFEVKLETLEEGKRYAVLVTPKNINTPGISVIQIETDAKVKDQASKQAFAMVHRP